jgi:hypothetical protein
MLQVLEIPKQVRYRYLFWFPGLLKLLSLELLPQGHGVLNLGHVGKVGCVRDTQAPAERDNDMRIFLKYVYQ